MAERASCGVVEVPQKEAATFSLAYVGGLPGGIGGTPGLPNLT